MHGDAADLGVGVPEEGREVAFERRELLDEAAGQPNHGGIVEARAQRRKGAIAELGQGPGDGGDGLGIGGDQRHQRFGLVGTWGETGGTNGLGEGFWRATGGGHAA